MPNDTRQIKFEIIGDAKGLSQTLEQAVRSVQNFAKQMAQATGGMIGGNVGTGGPYIPGAGNTQQQGSTAANNALVRSVEDNKKILDKLKGASTETLRTMADMAQREIDREKNAVSGLNRELDQLNRKFQEAKGNARDWASIGAGSMVRNSESEMKTAYDEIRQRQENKTTAEENIAVNQQIVDAADPPKPAGFFGKLGGMARGLLGRNGMRMLSGAAAFNAVGEAVTTGASEWVQQRFDVSNSAIMQAQALKQPGLATRQGDLSYALALARMGNGSREDMDALGHSGIARGISIGGKHFGSIGGIWSALTNPAGTVAGITRDTRMMDSEMKRDLGARLKADIAADPTFFAHAAEFQGKAGSRVAAMRMMGGGGGLNPMLNAGNSLGFGDEQVVATYASIANQIGRHGAQKLTQAVLAGMATGMDQGVLTQLATAGAMTGNSGLASLVASQGHMNLAARNIVGGAMASGAIDKYGARDVTGLGGMLGYGTSGPGGALAAQQNVAGIGGLNQLMSGSYDPYQQGMNYLYASRNAGPNASLYTMKELASGLDATSLGAAFSGGKLPDHLRATGVTAEMIQQQFRDVSKSMLNRVIGSDNTGMGRAAKALGGKGTFIQNLRGYVGQGKGRDERIGDVATLFHETYDMDMNTSRGMVRDILGFGSKMQRGKGGGDGAKGSPEFEELKQQVFVYAKEARMAFEQVGTLLKKLNEQLGPDAIQQVGSTFERLGDLDISAEAAAEKLNKLTGAADRAKNSLDQIGDSRKADASSTSSSWGGVPWGVGLGG